MILKHIKKIIFKGAPKKVYFNPQYNFVSNSYKQDAPVEEGNLDTYIHFLRKRLAFTGSRLNIKTVRGIGYILENAA